MDEPTIGLDPHQIIAIRDLINSLRGKMSVIISSHILPEIELVCDRVIIINQGSIVASGTPDSLRKDFVSADKYVAVLRLSPEAFLPQLKSVCSQASIDKSRDLGDGFFEYTLKVPINSNLGEKIINEFSKDVSNMLREVSFKKPTLEEIFMSATRRSWEQVLDSQMKGEEGE